jgi:tetratricopeptide (TPR) repeat protein
MIHLVWLLAFVLASPAAADKDKDKDKKKAPEKAAAVSAEDLVKQADAKVTAGDAAGAKELLQQAAAMPTATGDVSLRLGRLLESTHELDGAMDAYKAAADKLTGPAKGEALGRLALVQETRGVAEADKTAEAAAAADAAGALPSIALARLRAREGKADEALALAQKAVAAGGPSVADAQAALGRAQEAKGALAEAEAAYRAGGGADVTNLTAAVGLARVLRRTGRAAEALPLLEKVTTAAPGAVDAYKESARVKIAMGRGQDALGDASTAAALAENDPDAARVVQEATVAKALAYVAQNQPDLAIQDLVALRDKSPDLALARVGLGRAYAAKRQVDLALVELQKAVELDPKSADAQYQLGYVQHMIKRDAPAAVGPYEKAVAAEPGNVEYRTQLGAALAAANQPDRAIAELTKVTSTAGYKRPEGWIYLGQAQLGAKKYKDAIASLEKAGTLAPDNVSVETFLAWSYFGLKDSKNFVEHARKAKTLGQKEPTLMGYLARIEAGEAIK